MTTYLYVGFGDFVPGVPARDLTQEEWDALSDEARAVAEPLYQAVEDEAPPVVAVGRRVSPRRNAPAERAEAATEEAEDGREDDGRDAQGSVTDADEGTHPVAGGEGNDVGHDGDGGGEVDGGAGEELPAGGEPE